MGLDRPRSLEGVALGVGAREGRNGGAQLRAQQFVERHGLERRAPLLYLWDRKRLPGDWEWQDYDHWIPGEPSTIRTVLKVADEPSSTPPAEYPTYDRLTTGHRRRYLDWLAAERLDPEVPEGYANLFYLGLERRCFGEIRRAAWNEILALRRAFGGAYLIQVHSERVLAASAVAASDWEGLAELVEAGAFDAAPLGLKSLLVSYLGNEGLLDWYSKASAHTVDGMVRLPLNWLAEAAGIDIDSAVAGEPDNDSDFALPCFEAEVAKLFQRRSLGERLDDAGAALQPAEIELNAANRSQPFPETKPLRYLPILASKQLVRELQDAWKDASRLARVYQGEQGDDDEEEQAILAARQELLFDDWQTYDVGLALRRAGKRLRNRDIEGAERLLEEISQRLEPNRRQRGSIKNYFEKCRLARLGTQITEE